MSPVLPQLSSLHRVPHRAVVGPDLGQHRGVEHATRRSSAVAQEDVVDLTVRAAGGPGAAAHGAAPTREERDHPGAPEVAVAGDDRRAARAAAAAGAGGAAGSAGRTGAVR